MIRLGAVAAALLVAAGAGIRFRDSIERWGVESQHHHGGAGDYFLVESYGGGVVVFDFDGDGDQDVLFLDGAPMPGYRGETPAAAPFRNDPVGGSSISPLPPGSASPSTAPAAPRATSTATWIST